MKIVIIGGSGLIGSKVVSRLTTLGHDAIAASPASGVNTLTGEGLVEVLSGADVIVDVANSPSFEDDAVMAFFETSGRNLLAAEKIAGIRHHIALSVVGAERMAASGYMRAKVAQERLIRASGMPYTIIHSTQFFEFLRGIAHSGTAGEPVHLSPALFQPIAADDVADAIVAIVLGAPANTTVEIAGPNAFRLDALVRTYLEITGDTGTVITDPQARYFGAVLDDASLMPAAGARLGIVTFETWSKNLAPARVAS